MERLVYKDSIVLAVPTANTILHCKSQASRIVCLFLKIVKLTFWGSFALEKSFINGKNVARLK